MALKDIEKANSEVAADGPLDLQDSIDKEDPTPLCTAIAECYATTEADEERQWELTIAYLESALSQAKHRHEAAARAKSADVSGSAMVTLSKVDSIMPKGKHLDIVFGETELVVQGKDYNVVTPYSNIDVILKLPKYDALAKLSVLSYQFVLRLKTPVAHKKARLTCLSFVIGGIAAQEENTIAFHMDESEHDFTDKKLHEVTEMLLHSLTSTTVVKTYPEVSTKRYVSTTGAPFVKCYRRTTPGVLFFLPEGLCFLNPPVFLSRQEIDSISWSREASDALKTFDVTVELVDNTKVEFSMLEKEEIPSITEFVRYFGRLRDEDDGIVREESNEEDDQDGVDKDDDAGNDDDEDDEAKPSPAKKAKTTNAKQTKAVAAAATAAADDDDDEADSNFEMDDDDDESEEDWAGSESCSDAGENDQQDSDSNDEYNSNEVHDDDEDEDGGDDDDDDDE
ncbi:Aste57867_20128 [Aphanomyces stellatus]|uniref:FACT complex subunit SSRP1 n=1 Tax=Aphanomyces stellatus TaxID=120398 RepID=A0A485LE96_9STRA|nr:hypothetical protein As57867_020062 [Aphanomyces stellatus]VFT96823.1 Aste57867_20128 [Aphanomyces stellatus]